ncbi:MAG: [FeFe] hydrogenase H-cluster radical SAM maturase HydE [Elusimicrobiaceae bacterium]|nr:[FeFe] hydrogenase H-cluster radical SAM maturase HydE [Elusimicrobiaceae bacterium]
MSISKQEIIELLNTENSQAQELRKKAYKIKSDTIGKNVYLRALIEFTNACEKDCYYCGLRKSNADVKRYLLSEDEIFDLAMFAHENKFGSIALQSGEVLDKNYVKNFGKLLAKIKQKTNNNLRIVLSCGEQSKEVYKHWRECGGDRYLLRIETTNPKIYEKIHPNDDKHNFQARLDCLQHLRDVGFQVGSGMMVGLPYQNLEDIADDLLFLKEFDIDMCGLGPFIEHSKTPLYEKRNEIPSRDKRLQLALNSVAILRMLMPDINIASATSLDALAKNGREQGILAGANVIMPNITPERCRESYNLYERNIAITKKNVAKELEKFGEQVCWGKFGDSQHYRNRK